MQQRSHNPTQSAQSLRQQTQLHKRHHILVDCRDEQALGPPLAAAPAGSATNFAVAASVATKPKIPSQQSRRVESLQLTSTGPSTNKAVSLPFLQKSAATSRNNEIGQAKTQKTPNHGFSSNERRSSTASQDFASDFGRASARCLQVASALKGAGGGNLISPQTPQKKVGLVRKGHQSNLPGSGSKNAHGTSKGVFPIQGSTALPQSSKPSLKHQLGQHQASAHRKTGSINQAKQASPSNKFRSHPTQSGPLGAYSAQVNSLKQAQSLANGNFKNNKQEPVSQAQVQQQSSDKPVSYDRMLQSLEAVATKKRTKEATIGGSASKKTMVTSTEATDGMLQVYGAHSLSSCVSKTDASQTMIIREKLMPRGGGQLRQSQQDLISILLKQQASIFERNRPWNCDYCQPKMTPVSHIDAKVDIFSRECVSKMVARFMIKEEFYESRKVVELLNTNSRSVLVAQFKDYLIYDDIYEFLTSVYDLGTSLDILTRHAVFYDSLCSLAVLCQYSEDQIRDRHLVLHGLKPCYVGLEKQVQAIIASNLRNKLRLVLQKVRKVQIARGIHPHSGSQASQQHSCSSQVSSTPKSGAGHAYGKTASQQQRELINKHNFKKIIHSSLVHEYNWSRSQSGILQARDLTNVVQDDRKFETRSSINFTEISLAHEVQSLKGSVFEVDTIHRQSEEGASLSPQDVENIESMYANAQMILDDLSSRPLTRQSIPMTKIPTPTSRIHMYELRKKEEQKTRLPFVTAPEKPHDHRSSCLDSQEESRSLLDSNNREAHANGEIMIINEGGPSTGKTPVPPASEPQKREINHPQETDAVNQSAAMTESPINHAFVRVGQAPQQNPSQDLQSLMQGFNQRADQDYLAQQQEAGAVTDHTLDAPMFEPYQVPQIFDGPMDLDNQDREFEDVVDNLNETRTVGDGLLHCAKKEAQESHKYAVTQEAERRNSVETFLSSQGEVGIIQTQPTEQRRGFELHPSLKTLKLKLRTVKEGSVGETSRTVSSSYKTHTTSGLKKKKLSKKKVGASSSLRSGETSGHESRRHTHKHQLSIGGSIKAKDSLKQSSTPHGKASRGAVATGGILLVKQSPMTKNFNTNLTIQQHKLMAASTRSLNSNNNMQHVQANNVSSFSKAVAKRGSVPMATTVSASRLPTGKVDTASSGDFSVQGGLTNRQYIQALYQTQQVEAGGAGAETVQSVAQKSGKKQQVFSTVKASKAVLIADSQTGLVYEARSPVSHLSPCKQEVAKSGTRQLIEQIERRRKSPVFVTASTQGNSAVFQKVLSPAKTHAGHIGGFKQAKLTVGQVKTLKSHSKGSQVEDQRPQNKTLRQNIFSSEKLSVATLQLSQDQNRHHLPQSTAVHLAKSSPNALSVKEQVILEALRREQNQQLSQKQLVLTGTQANALKKTASGQMVFASAASLPVSHDLSNPVKFLRSQQHLNGGSSTLTASKSLISQKVDLHSIAGKLKLLGQPQGTNVAAASAKHLQNQQKRVLGANQNVNRTKGNTVKFSSRKASADQAQEIGLHFQQQSRAANKQSLSSQKNSQPSLRFFSPETQLWAAS